MRLTDVFIFLGAGTLPAITAVRAYRVGYKKGVKDAKTREILKRRYSKCGENKTVY